MQNATTKAFTYTIEGNVGASTMWYTLVSSVTSTGSPAVVTSTGETLFDKARLNVSANDSTGNVEAYLSAY